LHCIPFSQFREHFAAADVKSESVKQRNNELILKIPVIMIQQQRLLHYVAAVENLALVVVDFTTAEQFDSCPQQLMFQRAQPCTERSRVITGQNGVLPEICKRHVNDALFS